MGRHLNVAVEWNLLGTIWNDKKGK